MTHAPNGDRGDSRSVRSHTANNDWHRNACPEGPRPVAAAQPVRQRWTSPTVPLASSTTTVKPRSGRHYLEKG